MSSNQLTDEQKKKLQEMIANAKKPSDRLLGRGEYSEPRPVSLITIIVKLAAASVPCLCLSGIGLYGIIHWPFLTLHPQDKLLAIPLFVGGIVAFGAFGRHAIREIVYVLRNK